jgi:hypothetical protein
MLETRLSFNFFTFHKFAHLFIYPTTFNIKKNLILKTSRAQPQVNVSYYFSTAYWGIEKSLVNFHYQPRVE